MSSASRSRRSSGRTDMSELTTATAATLAARIASREVSAEEVTRAHLDRVAEVGGEISAFLHVGADRALESARAVDARVAAGEGVGPLAGVPIARRGVLTTPGAPTTCAPQLQAGSPPPYDATVTARLREAGMPILGKTNLDEFAMGSSTENSAYGPTRNPWDHARTPGGSGGGSAAALASHQAPVAVGTDTGGSIRQPAALTA